MLRFYAYILFVLIVLLAMTSYYTKSYYYSTQGRETSLFVEQTHIDNEEKLYLLCITPNRTCTLSFTWPASERPINSFTVVKTAIFSEVSISPLKQSNIALFVRSISTRVNNKTI